ncbi:multiple coagulation factor deficiency protein 2 [Dermatophagoides farinae]|uniref:Multiple coagulation factor deficiency protein 2 n=1 Tax=Dermatophagoides farinae TaxID=6954 RepID=A0A9D4P6L1_DERFA|nr:multiple coagulation factor deficiency protein 2 [Dermatophagoides farinae]
MAHNNQNNNGGGGGGGSGGSILYNKNFEHIKHDLKEQYFIDVNDDPNGHQQPQTQQEERDMIFYNFKLHDYDDNLRLDGLEILSSIYHDMEPSSNDDLKKMTSDQLRQYWHEQISLDAGKIDQILTLFDLDNDGYISYGEYLLSLNI